MKLEILYQFLIGTVNEPNCNSCPFDEDEVSIPYRYGKYSKGVENSGCAAGINSL